MSNEQKLREALQVAEAALSDIGDADREPGDDLAWCERRAAQSLPLIRQALALPTATPVGERELFERTMMDKYGWQHEDFKLDDFGYADGQTDTAWMAWQARAALSAGDAVLAEREACAKVCESRYMGDNNREDMEARQCAAAIRARGEAV